MRKIIISLLLLIIPVMACANYGKRLCNKRGYVCIRAKSGDSWKKLFPNKREEQIVRRINRTNTRLRRGMIVAVPKNLYAINHMEVSPFPHRIEPRGRNVLLINLRLQAFGAYDDYGRLLHWGPVSGGKGWCPDVRRRCGTPRGTFRINSKAGRAVFPANIQLAEAARQCHIACFSMAVMRCTAASYPDITPATAVSACSPKMPNG